MYVSVPVKEGKGGRQDSDAGGKEEDALERRKPLLWDVTCSFPVSYSQ